MAQSLTLKIKGLITDPNNLDDTVVDGGLSFADNIVVSKDNVAESRRGMGKYNSYLELGGDTKKIGKLYSYQNTIIAHHDSMLSRDVGSGNSWSQYEGTFASASDYQMKSFEENQNFYIATDAGVNKLDKIDGEFYKAGVVPSLDGFGSVTGSTGWFDNLTAIAYRMVWTREDENENLVIGAPSSRFTVINTTGSSANVALNFLIPEGITSNYEYQIYRSNMTETFTDEPTDELQLVLTGTVSTVEIDKGEFNVTDNVSDTLKGAFLYTSPSREGAINAAYEPPLCRDMTVFKNHAFYANTETKHTYSTSLLGTGVDGFDVDDTITIDGVVYAAKSTEEPASGYFKLFDSGSPASDITNTALSLVNVINKYDANTTVYAFYMSGYDDLPGKLRFQAKNLGQDTFYALSSNGLAWSPELPVSGTTQSSTNDAKVNRVYISKDHQPEAVPLLNYIDVGSANKAILRILDLRESLFVFKEDGIYKISGENVSNFRSTLHDKTTELIAPDTAVQFNNSVFCMSLQGVIAVSESEVAVVSRNIESELLKLTQAENFAKTAFGVSYESERSYKLYCVGTNADTYPKQAYVFNSFSQSWTREIKSVTCGFVAPFDDKLYLGKASLGAEQNWVLQERKSFSVRDFIDEETELTIVNVISTSGTTTVIEVNKTEDSVVDYFIEQTDAASEERSLGKITDIDFDNNYITLKVSSERAFDSNPANLTNVIIPILVRAKYVMNTGGNPGVIKQFREVVFFFRNDTAAQVTIGYETSLRPGYESTSSSVYNIGLWGKGNWGTQSWNGTDANYIQPLRVGIPRNKQRCIGISFSVEVANAFSPFALAGVSAQFEVISERIPYRGRISGEG